MLVRKLPPYQCAGEKMVTDSSARFAEKFFQMLMHFIHLACIPVMLLSCVSFERVRALADEQRPEATELEPIPEKLIVLTFDDSARSHYEVVRPILLKYGFSATFFVTEGFDFTTNKTDYMTWEEIAQLHRDGFEIGNHTKSHLSIQEKNADDLADELRAIRERCREHGIPAPVSFAWPGNAFTVAAFEQLRAEGIRWARRGGAPEYPYERGRGFAYEPGFDHPFLIPSAGDARPDWQFEDFKAAIQQAERGKIAVLQFHGVPDTAHSWVSLSVDKFEIFMHHLKVEKYRVIALRDLVKFVDPEALPIDSQRIIQDRRAHLASGHRDESYRIPKSDDDLRFWLENMAVHHRFSLAEMTAATGLSAAEIQGALERFSLEGATSLGANPDTLKILPYPGGRHPRSGFRDGMLRPQRETKLSIFAPWDEASYVVADFPEAIWWDPGSGRELLYLAHTHVPTRWELAGIELEKQEWQRDDHGWISERQLPNGVAFGSRAIPEKDHVRFEMWIRNDGSETARDIVVQQCVMLAQARGFSDRSNANKLMRHPFVACRNAAGDRWIITAWQGCQRPWANPPCPCIHSDPQFPDCPPGESRRLHGWVSFFQGHQIEQELDRIQSLGWLVR